MKKKYIIITICIILIICITTILINKNKKEYIIQNGVMLALTLDGEKISSYPEGRNYKIEIDCENGKGKWLVDEWKLAVEEVTGNVVCNLDFITRSNNDKLKTEVENKATAITSTNNAGTTETSNRYTGKQPNNWIWFNNEMWRIIGSIPACLNSSCSSKENLVKIIRAESIGGLEYDGVPSNGYPTSIWGKNTLYDLLNNYYYGKKNPTGASPCYGYSTYYGLCNYIEKGISSEATDYYGKMIKAVYWNIGTLSKVTRTIEVTYGIETSTVTSASIKIGIMAATDYGYASGQTTAYLNELSNYIGSNWLNSQGSGEWTMASVSPSVGECAVVSPNGDVNSTNAGNNAAAVRPVVYLDPLVYVVSGDGTEGNPYQIGM